MAPSILVHYVFHFTTPGGRCKLIVSLISTCNSSTRGLPLPCSSLLRLGKNQPPSWTIANSRKSLHPQLNLIAMQLVTSFLSTIIIPFRIHLPSASQRDIHPLLCSSLFNSRVFHVFLTTDFRCILVTLLLVLCPPLGLYPLSHPLVSFCPICTPLFILLPLSLCSACSFILGPSPLVSALGKSLFKFFPLFYILPPILQWTWLVASFSCNYFCIDPLLHALAMWHSPRNFFAPSSLPLVLGFVPISKPSLVAFPRHMRIWFGS